MLSDLKKCCGTKTSSNKNIVESPYAIIAEAMEEEERASNTQNVPKSTKKTTSQKVQNKVMKVVAKLCGNSSANETVSLIETSLDQNRASDAQNVPGTTATGSTRKYITYKEALKNLKESSERHLNDGYFMDKSDPKAKNFIDLVQKEVSQYVVGDSIKDLNLRGRKSKAFTAWVLLQDNAEFRVNESFLSGGKYGNPKVTAVTLLIPGEEKRGLRISIDEDKARLYEIVNGSYNMTFNWKVDDKNCSITMNVSINGAVTCTKVSEGLILEDLDKNKDVKIRIGGTKNRKMTLTELASLGRQQHKSHEVVKFVANDPEAKSALEELGSELQKGSPTEKSVQTESPESADVSRQPLTNITNVSTPQKLSSTQGVSK